MTNLPDQILLNKIVKLQEEQEKRSKDERDLLTQKLDQMNRLLAESIAIAESDSRNASGKKNVPFSTGTVRITQAQSSRPDNPDGYSIILDIYALNGGRIIPHMSLINDGPGDIYFITSFAKNVFNEKEDFIRPNDVRELFNVYELRLRATLPQTTFRLIEGILRTGSYAPGTKSNTEIRPTIADNEVLKDFSVVFDNIDPIINIISPTTQTLTPDFFFTTAPLPPGGTTTLFDAATLQPMPFTIPEGYIMEAFAIQTGFSTEFTLRNYLQLFPDVYTLFSVFPSSNRLLPYNTQLNLTLLTTAGLDPFGAPPGGRNLLITVTNDDPFNNMIGTIDWWIILRQIS